MRNRNIQSHITTGRLTLPVVILVCIACWILTLFVVPSITKEHNTFLLWKQFGFSDLPQWASQAASLALYALIGYLLIEINNTFSIIRLRASVQTSLYILLVTACPLLHQLSPGNIATLSLLVSLYFLLKSYQEHKSTGNLFHSFAFMGISTLLFPPLTLLFPIWIIGAYSFQSLTLRSFFAAILGWCLPYWFLLGHAFYYQEMTLFYAPFIEWTTFTPIELTKQLSPWEVATLLFLLVQFIVSATHAIVMSYQDKIRTRSYLNFLILVAVSLFVLILIQPTYSRNFLSPLLVVTSMLMGHLHALTNNRLANIFFICTIIGLISLFIFNTWMLL